MAGDMLNYYFQNKVYLKNVVMSGADIKIEITVLVQSLKSIILSYHIPLISKKQSLDTF